MVRLVNIDVRNRRGRDRIVGLMPITTDVVSSNLDQVRSTTLCDKVCQ